MNKKIFLIFIIFLFVGGVLFANAYLNHLSDIRDAENGVVSEKIEKKANTTKKVVLVNESKFDDEVTNYDGKVLVDFYADWCGPCKRQSPIIDELAKEVEDVKFLKVDTDANRNLSNEFAIRYIPTLILFENGKEKDRLVGLNDKETIKELIK